MYIPMAEAADSVELLMVGNGGGGLDRSGIWAGMDHLSLFISDVRGDPKKSGLTLDCLSLLVE